jgi:type IV secretion system protein TrbL
MDDPMIATLTLPPLLAFLNGPDIVNDVANQYIHAINNGFGLIRGDVRRLLNILIILSVMWSGTLWALSDDHAIVEFARKVIYIGLFVWIIQNWPMLTDKLASSFMDLGLQAGGFDGANVYTSQPGNIAYLGYTTAQPLLDQIGRLTGPVAFFKNIVEIIFLFLAVIAIVTSFTVIMIQVVMALLVFKFGSLVAFVLVPFAVLSKTSFIAERPLGWVVGSGIRLMVLTLVLGVGNNIFQSLQAPPGTTITTYQAFGVALASLLLMVLSLVASRLATDMIIGGPTLGVGTTVNSMAVAYNVSATSSRATVEASKAASKVITIGAKGAGRAGTAIYKGLRSVVNKFGPNRVPAASPAAAASASPKPATASNATNIASRVPGPNGTGPNKTGGSTT